MKGRDTLKEKVLFGQRPQEGTKSCRMRRNSICLSDHPSVHQFVGLPGGSVGQLEGSEGQLEVSESQLEGSECHLAGYEGKPG